MDIKRRFFFILAVCTELSFSSVVITPSTEEYAVVPLTVLEDSKNACQIVPMKIDRKWLGMVKKGGGCSTLSKYSNLKEMGASGMLILDRTNMEYTSTDLFHVIPIDPSTYDRLVSMYKKSANFPTVKITNRVRGSLPIVQILYILFLILMIFVFPSLFERLDEPQIKLVRPKDLSTVLLQKYENINASDRKYEECPICFEKFMDSEFIRTLQCSHYYHCNCIDPWLLSRSCRCPVCNHELSFT
ncbi:hypothetical protein NEAUS04_1258 [Nematocida ausubeli]|uniref:RING-type domain-containing protein n=1 Tax=Nematocida ausubeli (strain ATCC PRA-371 / ERTm2) TaxID=1913371 RepID=H8ZAQ8_NEMA1|nr:uncharacterized protein NESG_01490 [Nematocida ausubeli]EHY65961.1 hypothetical protein NERG_00657 [Nematocida ausubeli]KAI5132015.1 hypothetical protein NEAUS07_0014 [Nematocida ausubeli]KAI5134056.1 hypothetical protein NEAUS06_0890 [Nematocida ausubeli]KAI5147823.1 hypothetical protein NEAUS05_1104 [Nematocida ausubeli]KAI5162942.1 hypothetical protein NEAUS04_1258 [Nematocida ausubeli]